MHGDTQPIEWVRFSPVSGWSALEADARNGANS